MQATNEVTTHPHGTDWSRLEATTIAGTYELMRADLEQHFAAGLIGNIAGGWEARPVISHRQSLDWVELLDCQLDGTYWMDERTSAPAAGENPTPHLIALRVSLVKKDGTWRVIGVQHGTQSCTA